MFFSGEVVYEKLFIEKGKRKNMTEKNIADSGKPQYWTIASMHGN